MKAKTLRIGMIFFISQVFSFGRLIMRAYDFSLFPSSFATTNLKSGRLIRLTNFGSKQHFS